MYPASPKILLIITPLNSNTAGVSKTCIKTLLLCCRCFVPPSAICSHVRMYDPARWTADTRRRCCCRTEHGLTVIWVTSIYTQTNKHRVSYKQTCYMLTELILFFTALCHSAWSPISAWDCYCTLFTAICTLVHLRGLGIACRPSVRLKR